MKIQQNYQLSTSTAFRANKVLDAKALGTTVSEVLRQEPPQNLRNAMHELSILSPEKFPYNLMASLANKTAEKYPRQTFYPSVENIEALYAVAKKGNSAIETTIFDIAEKAQDVNDIMWEKSKKGEHLSLLDFFRL